MKTRLVTFALVLAYSSPTLAQSEPGEPAKVEPLPAPVKVEPPPKPIEATPPSEPGALHWKHSELSPYVESDDHAFYLLLSGRVHVDGYAFAGPGVKDYQRPDADGKGRQIGTGLKGNLAFRRFILEVGGAYKEKWFFWLGGNFAPSSLDFNQNPQSNALVYDGFVGYEADPLLRFQIGQFNTPFTMENVTSSRWLDFMERSLTVRTLGAPYNKDLGLMVWGTAPSGLFDYQVGVFGGDGMNRPSVDNRVDVMGRALVRPLASRQDALSKLHVGGSFRYGRRDPDYVFYDAPAMTTPGGYAYWTPVYGKGATETHVLAAKNQLAAAAELYVPLERVDLKGEFVYVKEGRREAFVNALYDNERIGTLSGFGAYAQIGVWLMGTPRVNGHPGTYAVIKPPKTPGAAAPQGLQLVLRGEILRLKYDSNDGTPTLDPGFLDKDTNKITVNAYQAALTYWATRHVRITAEYSLYQFPGTGVQSVSRVGEFPDPGKPSTNQATAPGARANAFDFSANHFHEFGVRVGLAL